MFIYASPILVNLVDNLKIISMTQEEQTMIGNFFHLAAHEIGHWVAANLVNIQVSDKLIITTNNENFEGGCFPAEDVHQVDKLKMVVFLLGGAASDLIVTRACNCSQLVDKALTDRTSFYWLKKNNNHTIANEGGDLFRVQELFPDWDDDRIRLEIETLIDVLVNQSPYLKLIGALENLIKSDSWNPDTLKEPVIILDITSLFLMAEDLESETV